MPVHTSAADHRTGVAHVAMMVQNVSLADDNRLQKQVDDLLAAGYRVTVVTRRDEANAPFRGRPGLALAEYPAPTDGDSTLTHLREYAVSLAWQLPTLLGVHRRHRIDVLQLCQPPDLYFPVARVMRRMGVRVLVDQRDLMAETLAQRYDEPPERPIRVLHWLEGRTQGSVDHTVTVNGYLRDRLVGAGGAPDRISVVYNGPVLARVDRARPDPALRRGLAHLVVWAGKMGKQDRVDQVLQLAHRVVHDLGRRDCAFMLAGDGECLADLRGLARALDLEDWVTFPGWLPEVELYSHLASADVGVDTSLQPEVTPVKAMEYLAVGLPLLAFDVQETRRLAAGAGVLVPSSAGVDVMAAELVRLLDDPAGRQGLGGVGRARIRRQLAWEHQSAAYLTVVDSLAQRSGEWLASAQSGSSQTLRS